MAKPPRVVAELGRPETPEETAARRAENSRKHRANQTTRNLVFSLAACLGVVLLLVLVVVRPDQPARDPVDWSAVAAQAQPAVDEPLAAPRLPSGWSANSADLETGADDIPTWYIGFISPTRSFIGLRQGVDADPRWAGEQVDDATATGSVEIGGVEWEVYDRREAEDAGNLAYALSAEVDGSTFVLFGTAPEDEFALLASSLLASLPSAEPAP